MTRHVRVLCVVLGALAPLSLTAAAQARTAPQPQGHTLSVTITGSGSVKSDDGKIACPPGCDQVYLSAATVTLTAAAGPGSTFAGWGGPCSGTAPTCTVTMSANQAVTATFTASGGSPPPPAAPSCTLHVPSAKVLLKAQRGHPAQVRKVGKLGLTYRCDQAVSVTLIFKVVVTAHGHSVTYRLTRRFHLAAHHAGSFTVSLWRGALRGLAHHEHETYKLSFTATNAHGGWGAGGTGPLKGVG